MSSVPNSDLSKGGPAAKFSYRLGLWQAAIAFACSELALTSPDYGLRGALLLFGLSAMGLFLISRWNLQSGSRIASRRVLLLLLTGVATGEILRLAIQPWNFPLELAVLLVLRTLCLILSYFSHLSVCMRSLGGASVCLVLFSSCLTDSRLGISLLLLYSIVAGLWMLSLYWTDVERDLPMQSSRRLPWAVLGWGWTGIILLVLLLTGGRDVTRQVIAELVGSSGGTGRQDDRANRGVNDGDHLVDALNNATTTGFSDSNLFLDSNERTLYDAADDRYGGTLRKKQERQRAINIGSASNVRKEQQNSLSLERQKSFGMRRQKTPQGKSKNDRPDEKIDALFCVHGPAPVHFATNHFAELSDDELVEINPRAGYDPLHSEFGGWFGMSHSTFKTPGAKVRHQVRVANLNSRQIMIPSGTCSFRMGLVNREDFFRLTDLGMLYLDDGLVPPGTTIETVSFVPDPNRLDESDIATERRYALPRYYRSLVSEDVAPIWRQTAEKWIGNAPRGWEQISRICKQLQTEYKLSDNVSDQSMEINGGILTEFLTESRSGPDYLFAASAVALLRELKYPSRIVGGFYADPLKFDEKDGHVYVRGGDLHFWAEVLLPDGLWVTVEPSPGYEVLGPQPSWMDYATARVTAFAAFLLESWKTLLLCFAGVAAAWSFRFDLLDRLMTLVWICKCTNSVDACIEGTWWQLQHRARWAGVGRRNSETIAGFLNRLIALEEAPSLSRRFRDLLERWIYRAGQNDFSTDKTREADIRSLCKQVIATWSLRKLRKLRDGCDRASINTGIRNRLKHFPRISPLPQHQGTAP